MWSHNENTITADDYERLVGLLRRLVNDGPLDRLIPQDEAAERLGIGRTKLFGMFGDGQLSRKRIGRRVFVLESELLDFMRKAEG
jgi:hypothetical protein